MICLGAITGAAAVMLGRMRRPEPTPEEVGHAIQAGAAQAIREELARERRIKWRKWIDAEKAAINREENAAMRAWIKASAGRSGEEAAGTSRPGERIEPAQASQERKAEKRKRARGSSEKNTPPERASLGAERGTRASHSRSEPPRASHFRGG